MAGSIGDPGLMLAKYKSGGSCFGPNPEPDFDLHFTLWYFQAQKNGSGEGPPPAQGYPRKNKEEKKKKTKMLAGVVGFVQTKSKKNGLLWLKKDRQANTNKSAPSCCVIQIPPKKNKGTPPKQGIGPHSSNSGKDVRPEKINCQGWKAVRRGGVPFPTQNGI